MTAKVMTSTYEVLTALAMIDQTNSAEQIRLALTFYFTLRMQDQRELSKKIAAERDRHEAALAVIDGGRRNRPKVKAEKESEVFAKSTDRQLDKPVTLRIDSHNLDLLTAFSLIDEKTLADVLRDAVDKYIEHRRKDPQLAQKLDAAKQEYDRTMSVLAGGS